ncbi:MAG TPA: carbon-nitrogen hydrolase family protein [Nitrospiria bacterium]|nr:carbon-nitrogen hydrolase family protein [Nitrospiria bacterium]
MVKVAAVQMEARPYELEGNLLKAERFVEEAARGGAQVVVLPELFNSGYCYDPRNFDVAEFISGRTGRWFRETAKRFGIFLAGAIIEKDFGRYYDTLVLSTPQGRLGSYRKLHLALQEKCFFSSGDYPLILDTDLGRIGTGICADLLYRDVWERYRERVDLLIISSAWPDFTSGRFPLRKTALSRQISAMPRTLPRRLAASLGVPVVYSNLCGGFDSPLPFLLSGSVNGDFTGNSVIVDESGDMIGEMDREEGVILGEVAVRAPDSPPRPGIWPREYRVEPSVRASAFLDRFFLGPLCWTYRRFRTPE